MSIFFGKLVASVEIRHDELRAGKIPLRDFRSAWEAVDLRRDNLASLPDYGWGDPELVALLSQHLKNYPPGQDGRVFTGPRGGIFNDRAYLKIFHRARAAAFTPRESASLLARRPYDLRPTELGHELGTATRISRLSAASSRTPLRQETSNP